MSFPARPVPETDSPSGVAETAASVGDMSRGMAPGHVPNGHPVDAVSTPPRPTWRPRPPALSENVGLVASCRTTIGRPPCESPDVGRGVRGGKPEVSPCEPLAALANFAAEIRERGE